MGATTLGIPGTMAAGLKPVVAVVVVVMLVGMIGGMAFVLLPAGAAGAEFVLVWF